MLLLLLPLLLLLTAAAAAGRVLEALHKGVKHPGIFTVDEMGHFSELLADAIERFHEDHERTYLGRTGMRRFINRERCGCRVWGSDGL
jgi:hypothetical protein